MMRRSNARVALKALAFLAGLAASGPAMAADPWQSPPPNTAAWEAAATAIPPGNIFPVSGDPLPAALVLLSARAVVPLTLASATQYIAPATAPADASLMPFLVRGVSREPCNGGFTVERNGSALWVDFSCVASGATAFAHKALVVYLPASAKSLYVTSSELH